MTILIIWITSIVSLLIGYMLGKQTTIPDMKTKIQNIKNSVDMMNVKSGPINRPTAKQLHYWSDPKKQATDEAMMDALRKIPLLNRKPGKPN